MAEDSPVQGLCEETTCSICLEYFKDPVITDCGHIFCQACLTQFWGTPGADASCPQCRETVQQKNFKPIRQLASIVEIIKKFSLHGIKGAEALGQVCERHQEPLKLFCQDDQTLICVVCDKSKEHREHKVIPKEEAFEEYKVKGQAYLESLKEGKEAILSSQKSVEVEGQTLLEQTGRERQKIMAEFKQLHQFLEEHERHLLGKLKDLDDQIKDKQNAHIVKLSGEISAVDLLIKEMEKKQNQPANEFLQGLGNILQRGNEGKFVNPEAFPLELKQQVENFSEIHPFLDTTMNEFKETVLAGHETKKANFTDSEPCTVPTLVLSANCSPSPFSLPMTQQHAGYSRRMCVSNNFYQSTYQFGCWSYVMGVERINSGSCSWVMNVKDEKFWAVGVALEHFRGRHMSLLTPKEGIWAVGMSSGTWYAFTSPGTYQLICPWSSNPMPAHHVGPCNATAIRISLNCEQHSVTFFNADNNSLIYTFPNASFSGQPVSSWFLVGK